MDNTLYVGVSRQMILQRELDVAANNIANTDTTGFKVESLMSSPDPETPPGVIGAQRPIQYAIDHGLARDFSQDKLTQTGSPLDLAIDGQAFFTITTANGDRYTRDGRFTLDPQGRLATQSGDVVQSSTGGAITLDPTGGPPVIARDGTVSQSLPGQFNETVVGKIGVVRFDSLSALTKDGNGLYTNTSSTAPQPAPDAYVHQGMLEASNVQPIVQITDLIRITRAYESISNLISSTSDLSNQSIQRLGAVQ
ncbi:MAG TPA: flagellar basal-body rod protein FlgF [Caulobacteraceae bacterium]|nr:flagellar basal-body rod protein FlgF [Caulobacteraceae bacterium]